MNKTLLLILCDFLLLNLLALTRWEKAEPSRPRPPPVPQTAGSAPVRDQDLVDVMRLSLEDERAVREQVAAQLQSTQTALQEREQNLGRLQAAKSQVEAALATTQQSVRELGQRVTAATQDATLTRERLAQMQRDLEAKQTEAARQQEAITALERQQGEARARIENLSVAVKVAEQEKVLLRENLEETKQQVVVERQERQKVLAQTGQLADGVGRLAEKSGEIAQEIRDNRPINANVLFNDFLTNRVFTTFTAGRPGLFGAVERTRETRTVLVSDGRAIYALLHANNTPFPVTGRELPVDWERIAGQFGRAPLTAPIPELRFLSLDPRIVVIPVEPDVAARLGVKVYQTALEPFKFGDAMLVSNGGSGYGEVPFKLDAQTPQYVRMDNRFFKRLAGEFTPSTGDLVFSKTGELLGIMVNDDFCAVIDNFLPARTIKTGEKVPDQRTGAILNELVARLHRLPFRLQ